MKGAGKFEASSSKIVFEDSEEDLSCSSVSSSDEVSNLRVFGETLCWFIFEFWIISCSEWGVRKKKQRKS